MLYLEDLAPGMIFTSGTYALNEDEIKAFAAVYDPQSFHLDDDAAKGTIFGGLAASGWHTAAITMKLNVGSVNVAGGIVGGGGEISWPRPTRAGDVLQVFSEVLEVIPSRSKPNRGMFVLRSETRNQKGDVLQVLTAKLIAQRRPV